MDAAKAVWPASLWLDLAPPQQLMKLNLMSWDPVKIVPENALSQAFIKAIQSKTKVTRRHSL
jgi:hypothetical protein